MNVISMKFYRSVAFNDLSQKSLVHHLSTISKDFFSEITGSVSVKFYVHHPSKERVKKHYLFIPGHMAKTAAMTIYGRNLKKFSSPGAHGRLS